MISHLFSLFFIHLVSLSHGSSVNSEANLKLLISIDDELIGAKSGILTAINEFHDSFNTINLSTTIIPRISDEYNGQHETICSNFINSGDNLVILEARSSQTRPQRSDLKMLARSLVIPMISVTSETGSPVDLEWTNLDYNEAQYLITFQQPLTMLMRSLIDIANYYSIKHGIVFFEPEMKYHVGCLEKENSLVNFTFMALETFEINGITEILSRLKKNKQTEFFVFGRVKIINKFIEAFRVADMFRQPFRLIVISKDKGKIKCVSCKHGQLIIGQPIMNNLNDYVEPSSIMSLHIEPTDEIEFYYFYDLTRLVLESIVNHLMVSGQWFPRKVVLPCGQNELTANQVKSSPVPFFKTLKDLSEESFGKLGPFVVTDQNKQLGRSFWSIGYQEISMRLKRHIYYAESVKQQIIGEWESGLPLGRIFFTAKLASDDDEALKIAVFQTPPFLMKRLVNGSSDPIYEGFLIDLLNEIKSKLGDEFPTYELIEPPSEPVPSIGAMKMEPDEENEVIDEPIFTGLIGAMIDEEAYDMILAPVEITEDRTLGVDFTEPFFDSVGFSILMKKPIRESHVWKFVTVLENDVWLCITGAYLVTSILLAIFDKYSPYSYRNRPEKYADEECKKIFTLKESLWFCFISLTPQGGGDAPKCISGRLVAAIWWLFGFIFVASYTANLAAFLTVSRLENKVDDLESLSRQYKIRYAPIADSAADSYFIKMAYIEDKYYEIWKNLSLDDDITEDERANLAIWEYPVSDKYTKIKAQMVEAKRPESLELGFARVRESINAGEGFALISTSLDVEYLTFLHCDVYQAGDDFAYHPIALAFAKESPHNELIEKINPIIRQLKDSGFITQLKVKYWDANPGRKKCPDWRKLSNGLSLFDTWGMFLVVTFGLIVTFIVISFENFMITRWQKRTVKNMKNDPKKFLR